MKVIFTSPANHIYTVKWMNALSEKVIEKQILISLKNHTESIGGNK